MDNNQLVKIENVEEASSNDAKIFEALKSDIARTVSISEYVQSLERLASTNSDFIFSNSNSSHAAAVLETFFYHANTEIRIYDDKLNGDITENNLSFFMALDDFISPGKKLKMVIKNKQEISSSIYKKLKEFNSNENCAVDIRLANDEFKKSIFSAFQKDIHFAVADSKMIRVEPDPTQRKAICSFNRPEDAKKLEEIFDEKFYQCEKFSFDLV